MMNESLPEDAARCLQNEKELFRKNYSDHFIEGETHGPEVGEPYLLYRPGARRSVLLIHGFMAAPMEVRQWAEDLFSHGYTVFAPRLTGHGTSAVDLSSKSFRDWTDSVEGGYRILAFLKSPVIVAGFSTGAGLALYQAVRHPDRYAAVVSVSAPMKFSGFSPRFSMVLELWNNVCKWMNRDSFQKLFAVNHPDNPDINYHRCPIHGFNQIKRLMRHVKRGLPGIHIPALVIQGSGDPKVSPDSGPMIFNRIGAVHKFYAEVDHMQHGIVRDAVGQKVFRLVREFLGRLTDET